MLRLIADFDGPIIDVSHRYYRVYQWCLAQARRPEQTVRELSKAEFWQLKRSRIPETQIGLRSGLDTQQAQEFALLRRKTVHTIPYLSLDTPIEGAIAALERLEKAGVDLVVMTMRRDRELNAAFTQHNLGRFFSLNRRYCLRDDAVKTSDVQDKPLLMARALGELPPVSDTWMVGDTEADIVAAKTHGIKVIAVLSGIRDREQLSLYEPDWIVQDLAEAVEIVLLRSQTLNYSAIPSMES